jgi:hypothetical protein
MAYDKPGIELTQQYQTTDVPTIPDQYAILMGPVYVSFNYPDDKSDINVGEYNYTVDADYDVYSPANHTVVSTEIEVTLEGVLLQYYSYTAGTIFYVKSTSEPYIIEGNAFNFAEYTNALGATYARNAALINRDVQVGDYAYVSKGAVYFLVKITGLENEVIAAVTGAFAASAGNLAATTQDATIDGKGTDDPDDQSAGNLDAQYIVGSYNGDMTSNPAISEDTYTVSCTHQGSNETAFTYNFAYTVAGVGPSWIFDLVDVGFDATYGYTYPSQVPEYYAIYIIDVDNGGPAIVTYDVWKCGSSASTYTDTQPDGSPAEKIISGATTAIAGGGTVTIDIYGLIITFNAAPGAGSESEWEGKFQKIEIQSAETRFMVRSVYGDDVDDVVFPGIDAGTTDSYNIPIGENGMEIIVGDTAAPGSSCPVTSALFTLYDPTDPTNTWSFKCGVTTPLAIMQYDAITGTSAGTYTGTKQLTLTVECTKGGFFDNAGGVDLTKKIYLQVRSSDGLFKRTITGISQGVAFDIGYGVTLDIDNNTQQGIATGDVFYVICTPATKGGYIYIKTDTDMTTLGVGSGNPINIDLFIRQASADVAQKREENQSLDAWTYDSSTKELTLQDSLYLRDSAWTNLSGETLPIPVITEFTGLSPYRPTVYVGSKYLVTEYKNQVVTIITEEDGDSYFGEDEIDNVLRHAVSKSILNGGGRPIKCIALESDDEDGYTAALNILKDEDTVYHMVPLTDDLDVFALMETHINSMSSASNKKFRIMYFARELINYQYLFNQYLDTSSGVLDDYKASVTLDAVTSENTLVTMSTDGSPDLTVAVQAGDKFQYNFEFVNGVWTYDEYTVDEVLTKYTMRLTSGPAVAVPTFNKCRIKEVYSTSQIATAMKTWAEDTANRRITNIVLAALTEDSTQVDAFFMCAAIAGLKTSYPAHKPLTNVSVEGFDRVYTNQTYSEAELNTMAEGGNFIIAQNTPTSVIYVRHQLTTKMTTQDQRELSLVCTLDLFCTAVWRAQQGYIGPNNISPALLDRLRFIVDSVGDLFTHEQFGILGPYLNYYELTTLKQNATFLDRVTEDIRVELPDPFNHLDIFVNVF